MRAHLIITALVVLLGSVAAASAPAAAAPPSSQSSLAVLTSYPPEFYQPFVERYRELHPDLQIQVLNKKTAAAVEEIRAGNRREFDIFWSSSADAFEVLKAAHLLLKEEGERFRPGTDLGGISLHDPDGYYFSFALSSVGFMYHYGYLRDNGLLAPTEWRSLARPDYYGCLAMSTPSRSGTTHMTVESILQSMGWRDGWAFLLQMAGNLSTITARSFSVPEGIAAGRFGIGLTIDFLAFGQRAVNPDIDFRYGEPTLVMPACIGLLEGGGSRESARSFLEFVLSPDGQALLLDPAINRLPVLGEVYADGKAPPDLYRLIKEGKTRPYDTRLSSGRYQLVNNLFDQLITYTLLERRRVWKRLIELEKDPLIDEALYRKLRAAVLDLVGTVPISEAQSTSPRFNDPFTRPARTGETNTAKRALLLDWELFGRERLEQAQILLDGAWRNLSGTRTAP